MDGGVSQTFWMAASAATCAALLLRFPVGLRWLLVIMMMPDSVMPTQLAGITGLNAFNPPFLILVLHVLTNGLPPARYPRPLRLAFWLVVGVFLVAILRSVADFGALVQSETGALTDGDSLVAYVRDYLVKPAQYLFALVVAARYLSTEAEQRSVLLQVSAAYSISCLVVMLESGLLHKVASGSMPNIKEDPVLAVAFGGHPNSVFMHMAAMLFAAAVLAGWGLRGRGRTLAAGCVPVLGLSILVCGSRAAMLALLGGASVIVLTRGSLKTRVLIGSACGGAVLLGIAMIPSIREKAAEVVSVGPWRALYAEREDIWDYLRGDVKSRPLLGNGRHAIARSPQYDEIKRRERAIDHPHNAYLEITLDSGVIGLALVLNLLARVVQQLRSRLKRSAGGAAPVSAIVGLCVLAAFCVAGLSGQTFYPRGYNLILWLVLLMGTREVAAPVQARAPLPRQLRPRTKTPLPLREGAGGGFESPASNPLPTLPLEGGAVSRAASRPHGGQGRLAISGVVPPRSRWEPAR